MSHTTVSSLDEYGPTVSSKARKQPIVRFSRPKRVPSALASLAILAVAFTFFAAQIDFARRNRIGITAEHYWWPQLTQIWLPGLGLALVLGLAAFVLHRRDRRA